MAEASSAYDPTLQHATQALHQFGFTDPQSYAVIMRTLENQAYLMSSIDLFWISAWLSVAMVVVIWFARRSFGGGGAPVAAD